jgi:Ca2+-binding EF-hand superfamily protein
MAHGISQEALDEIGLEPEQVNVLKKCFDGFCVDGAIHVDTIGTILSMMGLRVKPSALKEIVKEIDADGSGYLEFEEFCQLSAKFLIEEDEEGMKRELKEAFRIYDKAGNGFHLINNEKKADGDDAWDFTNEQVIRLFKATDIDKSGTVDFDEFMEMMTG